MRYIYTVYKYYDDFGANIDPLLALKRLEQQTADSVFTISCTPQPMSNFGFDGAAQSLMQSQYYRSQYREYKSV